MKRIVAVFLVICMIFTFASCSAEKKTEKKSSAPGWM